MRPKAPPVTGSWVNCDPIPQADLRDRVTVLLFWSLSCETSWRRLRQLETLRDRLGSRVAVVAVHSPRLRHEADEALVTETVARAGVSVPVVHDPTLQTYGHYGLEGRPSTVVIDHRCRVVGSVAGLDEEGLADDVVELADSVAGDARRRSGKVPAALPAVSTRSTEPAALDRLAWPSDVAILPSGAIVVADSGNHRLLTFTPDEWWRAANAVGEIDGLHGLGRICPLDGWEVAVSFADAGRVEKINLETGTRETLLDGLVRPRALLRDRDGSLLVADAGADQLLRVDADGTWGPVAGSGFTGVRDGPAGMAELAQPVGMTRIDRGIMFSEVGSNALRLLTDGSEVLTLTAHDRDDGEFLDPGLVDGPAHGARLERPAGLATLPGGTVVVADTGNDRLRVLAKRRLRTVPLAGLCRPEAIAHIDDERVVVADTGNHRLVVVDLAGGESWALGLQGLLPPDPVDAIDPEAVLEGVVGGSLLFQYPTPGSAPWTISVSSEPDWLVGGPVTVRREQEGEPVVVPLRGAGEGAIVLRVSGADGAGGEIVRSSITVLEDCAGGNHTDR